jgi:hypothetical protein
MVRRPATSGARNAVCRRRKQRSGHGNATASRCVTAPTLWMSKKKPRLAVRVPLVLEQYRSFRGSDIERGQAGNSPGEMLRRSTRAVQQSSKEATAQNRMILSLELSLSPHWSSYTCLESNDSLSHRPSSGQTRFGDTRIEADAMEPVP